MRKLDEIVEEMKPYFELPMAVLDKGDG